MRRGEALALRWSEFDSKVQTLAIGPNREKEGSKAVIGDLKTAASRRVIPLPGFVVEALGDRRQAQIAERLHLEGAGLARAELLALSSTPFGPCIDPDHLSTACKCLAVKAGLGDWHLHELRHSAASFMLSGGVALEVAADTLGAWLGEDNQG